MSEKILFEDVFRFSSGNNCTGRIKARFNKENGIADPIEEYKKNPDIVATRWLFWSKKQRPFFEGDIAIGFVRLNNLWLLTTIKRVTKDVGIKNGINYEAEVLEEYRPYFGRVLVEYQTKKGEQNKCVKYDTIKDRLFINQILPAIYDGDDFPGYDKVKLSYAQLETIINRNKKDWVAALSNQKGVYLITDTLTGKLYVGSATSKEGMLLKRWKDYADNGHGHNVELEKLVKEKGFDYVKEHFQYSLLENYNSRVDDDIIRAREQWWKRVLCSGGELGYNRN